MRTQILEEMKERWYGLSPTGWHNLVVGLLRDRQYELALDKFEQMQADQIGIKPWLYDIFFFKLCELDELDEALRLLKSRYDQPVLAMHMYYHLLDSFASSFHVSKFYTIALFSFIDFCCSMKVPVISGDFWLKLQR